MAEIPSSIPSEIRAGDTARWRRSLSDYPASDGWALSYTLVGPTAVYSATAAADGDAHLLTVPAATTVAWEPGLYSLQEAATKGADRFTVGVTALRILADLASTAAGGADTRTHARKVLDSIEAWLESKAPVAGEVQIGDRRIRNYPLEELLALRDRYLAEVKREEAAQSGLGGRRLLVRC